MTKCSISPKKQILEYYEVPLSFFHQQLDQLSVASPANQPAVVALARATKISKQRIDLLLGGYYFCSAEILVLA